MHRYNNVYLATLLFIIPINTVFGQADSTVTIHFSSALKSPVHGNIIFHDDQYIHLDRGPDGVLIVPMRRVKSIIWNGQDVTREYLPEPELMRRLRKDKFDRNFVGVIGSGFLVGFLLFIGLWIMVGFGGLI